MSYAEANEVISMKKVLLFLVVCILMGSLVLAEAQKGIHEAGTGIEDPELKAAGQGTGQGLEADTSAQSMNKGGDSNIQSQQKVQANNPESGDMARAQEQVQQQTKAKTGSYTTENGKQVQVQEQANNRIQLKSGSATAQTSMQMTQEQTQGGTRLQVKLSNGKNSEVKVMPDTASERALERLRMKVCSYENGCSLELKEVGQGEQARAAYEVQAQKQAKVLGLFRTKMQVQAQVDAENGEVIQTKKPWWAFLASEPE